MKDVFTSKRCEWIFSRENRVWKARLKKRVAERNHHLWILSSGTGRARSIKAIAHRKEGFLVAAAAANRHLQSNQKDIWFNVLPSYHVGGLSIYARASLSGAKVFLPQWRRWSAVEFTQQAAARKATLSSLVPTQIFDLVRENLPAPMSLRAIVVGGGALSPRLYKRARDLGWPLLPSYGLTECASQVATASMESLSSHEFPPLKPLDHVELRLRGDRLEISSPAVCEWVSTLHQDGGFTLENPAPYGWLLTEDRAELSAQGLKVLGRSGDLVKVLGVLVNVEEVGQRIQAWQNEAGLGGSLVVAVVKDERRDHGLILVTDTKDPLPEWSKFKDHCNKKLDGPERLSQMYWVEKIPRTDLGKIKKIELLRQLGLKS